MGCRLWGRTESDTIEATQQQQQQCCLVTFGENHILAWEIAWTEETDRQQSMGSQRVRHDLAHPSRCSRARWPLELLGGSQAPRRAVCVFLPGESHGQRRLVGYSPWGHKESDRTEGLTLSLVVVVSTYKRLLYKIKKAQSLPTEN